MKDPVVFSGVITTGDHACCLSGRCRRMSIEPVRAERRLTSIGRRAFDLVEALAADAGGAAFPPPHPANGRPWSDQRCRSISERPAWVEDRVVPGHWEAVLLCGSGNRTSTLVERKHALCRAGEGLGSTDSHFSYPTSCADR